MSSTYAIADGTLHPGCARIFKIDESDTDHTGKQLLLHTHQREAILKAKEGRSYVLTSGTGSGKSLTYIVPNQSSGESMRAIFEPLVGYANSVCLKSVARIPERMASANRLITSAASLPRI